ncbi:hypothetical protein Pcac1_g28858 [Phytophthora cactorum]|nr:hypothetical protein Pcac1_g29046 [Phytophthora cactorum]KAG2759105.1 hypothetical protein Pcac1_g28858 [Phytophthora cactorum]
MPPSVPTGLKKRKPRPPAKIREIKRARAAKRAAADAASGSTVDNTSATEARTTGDPRDVSEEAGSVSVAEDRNSMAAEATATHPDSSVTNPVTRATDSLTSIPDCTDVVTDQATANQASIATNQNDADDLEGNSGTWVCLVCTWSNTGDVEACTSCKVERSTSPATATDHDAIAGTDPIAAGATDQTTGATEQVAAATDSMYYPIYGQYYGSDRVKVIMQPRKRLGKLHTSTTGAKLDVVGSTKFFGLVSGLRIKGIIPEPMNPRKSSVRMASSRKWPSLTAEKLRRTSSSRISGGTMNLGSTVSVQTVQGCACSTR